MVEEHFLDLSHVHADEPANVLAVDLDIVLLPMRTPQPISEQRIDGLRHLLEVLEADLLQALDAQDSILGQLSEGGSDFGHGVVDLKEGIGWNVGVLLLLELVFALLRSLVGLGLEFDGDVALVWFGLRHFFPYLLRVLLQFSLKT